MSAETGRSRIVILGAGFAGATCARALEKELRADAAEIVLLDRRNYMVFTPLLVEAGTGSLQPRHSVVPVRAYLRRTRFLMAEALDVDVAHNEIRYRMVGGEAEQSLAYDQLVLALGSVTRMPPVPGLAEHGFGMKSMSDAVSLRDRAIAQLERADSASDPAERRTLLHFVVVGASFTGVEVAGEFLAYLRQASRRYPRVAAADCNMTVIEQGSRILPALDEDLSRYAERRLAKQGVRILLQNSVREIGKRELRLSDDSILASETVIWCAGIAAPPSLWGDALPTDARGYLLCEADTRIRGRENLWGIGDCAVNVDASGESYPATAQHAVREGRQLAANLARALRGEPTLPMNYRSRGALAALGCRSGVARVYGVKLAGFWAWFLWRTVYLLKMPGLSRRVRVALDWALDLLFKKDYVALGLGDRDRSSVKR